MKTPIVSGRLRMGFAFVLGISLVTGALVALADQGSPGFAPDPPGHASVKQWVFDVRVERGKPFLERARAATLPQPAETKRVLGRYAIELYVGSELLDRVRFNIPMAGDGAPGPSDRPNKHPFSRPRFDDVTTRLRAQMADNPRGAHLALVDRATEHVDRFEWPPAADGTLTPLRAEKTKADAGPPPTDGGASGDSGSKADSDHAQTPGRPAKTAADVFIGSRSQGISLRGPLALRSRHALSIRDFDARRRLSFLRSLRG